MRWNLMINVSDVWLVVFSDIVFGVLSMALSALPIMTLFARITPIGVEATIFAFLTGISNFSDGVITPNIGALINHHFF